nr:uncharacterized protein LOC131790098 isoform X2 [Pocillopora verrucosa]
MTSARERFFRQKVLTKLFPSEVESDSSDDDNDDDAGVETNSQFIVRTLDKDSQERSAEREKRKLSVAEDINFPRPHKVSLRDEQATPSSPSRLIESLSAVSKKRGEPKDEKCREHTASGTGSDLSKSSEQASKLSKNQKRKLKKKRHKERIRSSGVEKTAPAPKEFTYDTA